ncbi:hypothetical protein DPMN_175452 [Dreissena polymorpha]|uniref:Uncharacterized protein n=1 Tax=Dreissena polymorpha TaxID=45954 RepID=A0A9D4IG22_DREPO|nr:hypothetical protein DPMN_175452 [Dreissena polymorpha]
MDAAVPDRTASPPPPRSSTGTVLGLLEFLSVDGLPKTIIPITTRHPHGPKPGSNTPSKRRPNGLSRTVTAELRTHTRTHTEETRINKNQHGPARQRHGLTRHLYGPNPI